ncbi:flavodoxin family protein [Candidatus Poribacteria bacterium]|nr:flavodoxin family protein [Candidatus Poribacteria bacterium]
MKVIAFNGSPRKEGNTYQAIQIVFDELKKEGIETELIQLGGKQIHGCLACYKCFENKDNKCSIKTDELNDYIDKMLAADGIIIGSPVYFSNVSSEVKALIDRAGLVSRANNDLFKRKVGAAVVAMRRAGGCPTFAAINFFFLIGQMIVPGSTYWNLGVGRQPGDIQKDEEGIETFRNLGKNMAWLLKKISL